MARLRHLLVAAVLAGCSSPGTPVPAPSSATAPVQLSTQRLRIPVVVLAGSPADMGTAQGDALADSIRILHDQYLGRFIEDGTTRLMANMASDAFEAKLRPEHRAEVSALAKSCRLSERDAMLANCFLDLMSSTGCSTVALPPAASPDSVARFGRNLDFWPTDTIDTRSVLFVVRPDDGRYAFASVGWPGMVGVLSGMNQHGLCLANMEVPRDRRLPSAMPYMLLYRTVLEHCRTVDEAIALLKSTPIQTANNLMLADAVGGRAVVELSPSFVHVRRADDRTALISTNHQRDQEADRPGECDRYDYLHDASRTDFGGEDLADVESMLKHVGRKETLQSMVFEPAARVLYLSTGLHAADGRFERIDLATYFERTPVRH